MLCARPSREPTGLPQTPCPAGPPLQIEPYVNCEIDSGADACQKPNGLYSDQPCLDDCFGSAFSDFAALVRRAALDVVRGAVCRPALAPLLAVSHGSAGTGAQPVPLASSLPASEASRPPPAALAAAALMRQAAEHEPSAATVRCFCPSAVHWSGPHPGRRQLHFWSHLRRCKWPAWHTPTLGAALPAPCTSLPWEWWLQPVTSGIHCSVCLSRPRRCPAPPSLHAAGHPSIHRREEGH